MIGPTNGGLRYRIIIRGECGRLVGSLTDNVQVEHGRSGNTYVVATVRDDPELWGLLEQLQDLGLHMVSLQELDLDVGDLSARIAGAERLNGWAS